MPVYSIDGMAPTLPESGDYWIAPNATVIGDVTLGEGVSIWFGTTIRGDNEPISIGAGSNVQEACIFHTDPGFPMTLAQGVTVGHRAILHGCRIGANSLIGMGAIVLNGAEIGENCLIGAGALVAEGKTIPDNSLVVGAPGRIVRSLDDAAIDGLRRTAAHYVQNGERFATGLAPVD